MVEPAASYLGAGSILPCLASLGLLNALELCIASANSCGEMQNIRTALRLTSLGFVLLAVTISPWLFGSVQPWALVLEIGLLLVAALLAGVSRWVGKSPDNANPSSSGWSRIGIVGLLFGLLGCAQLVELPKSLGGWIASSNLELREDFGQDVESPRSISLSPSHSRPTLALVFSAVLACAVTARCIESSLLRVVLLAVVANGALIALLAIWQRMFGDNLIYGIIEPGSAAPIGPFVNRNNASGYLLMSLAAGIATLGLTWTSMRNAEGARFEEDTEELSFLDLFRNPVGLIAIVSSVLVVTAIFMGASRGGCVALISGAIVASFLASSRKQSTTVICTVVGCLLLSIGIVFAIEQWQPFAERISTLSSEQELAKEGRLTIWAGCLALMQQHWFLGTGIGTFEQVYPVYAMRSFGTIVTHAENQFIQVFCETGIVGFSLLVAGLLLFAIRSMQLLSDKRERVRYLGAAAVFFLTSQVIAAFFDFGLSITANALLCAFLIGIFDSSNVVSKSARKPKQVAEPARSSFSFGKYRSEIVLAGTMVFCVLLGSDVMQSSALEKKTIQAAKSKDSGHGGELDRLIRNINYRWDDADAQQAIAEKLVERFRFEVLPQVDVAPEEFDAFCTSMALRDQLGESSTLEWIDQRVEEYLKPAYQHLLYSRDACCLSKSAHLRLAQLSFVASDAGGDVRQLSQVHLDRAVRLKEGYSYQLFEHGKALFAQQDFSTAFRSWRKCLSDGSVYTEQILAMASTTGNRDLLRNELYPDSQSFRSKLEDFERKGQISAVVESIEQPNGVPNQETDANSRDDAKRGG